LIERFHYYIDENLAKKQSPDRTEAKSLIEKASQRMNFIKIQKIDEATSTFIFEDIYECIREAAQSLMSLDGYKPYSHEAMISFLKEFYSFNEQDIITFDRYRILRNNCIYRAAKVSPETCKEALKFLEVFLPKLKIEFERKCR